MKYLNKVMHAHGIFTSSREVGLHCIISSLPLNYCPALLLPHRRGGWWTFETLVPRLRVVSWLVGQIAGSRQPRREGGRDHVQISLTSITLGCRVSIQFLNRDFERHVGRSSPQIDQETLAASPPSLSLSSQHLA